MSATIGRVSAVFTASTSGLTSGINQANRSMASMQRSVSSLRGSMSSLVAIQGAQLFGSIVSGVSRAIAGLAGMARAQAEVVDQTSKMAQRLGMTYGQLAGLALAGDLAGVSLDKIGAAATKADVAFVKASQGSKQAIAAFGTLGLSVAELERMSAAERFDAIAAAIAALPAEAQRAAIAVQIFGRAGAELLPLFNQGAEGIAAARAEAEAFGLTLTNAQGQNIESMNDAFTRAGQAIAGVVQQVEAYLAPAIDGIVTQFSDFIASAGGANIGQNIGRGLIAGAEYLASVADTVVANFGGAFEYLSKVWQRASAVMDGMNRVASFLNGVFASFQAAMAITVKQLSSIVAFLMQGIQKLSYVNPGVRFAAGSQIDQVTAAAVAFDQSVGESMTAYTTEALDSFASALGAEAATAGEEMVGPWQQVVRDWRATAERALASIDAAPTKPVEVRQVVEASGISQALKAVDSRSKEGVAEMFRIMRGGQDNTAERTADAAERTAEATESLVGTLDMMSVEF